MFKWSVFMMYVHLSGDYDHIERSVDVEKLREVNHNVNTDHWSLHTKHLDHISLSYNRMITLNCHIMLSSHIFLSHDCIRNIFQSLTRLDNSEQ